jgi:meiosis induction protein kinase IME2/SME1
MPPPPAPVGAVSKKKKWGLSSVFGSSEKHLPPVDEHTGYAGSSLKRTQSGNQPRPVDPATILDPKKAKKEAERQAREVEKQKREAAVERQKERARAVMQKREGAVKQGQDFELNASSSFEPSKLTNVNNLGAGSSANLGQTASGSRASLALPHPAGQSAVSVHSHESGGSQSVSIAALAQRDRMEMERDPLYGARHKARRRDDDLDHSRSSLDINSLKSRSALTIGTVDSE